MVSLGWGLGLGQAIGFRPRSLFAGGAPGAWYDPSDQASMFQDSAGTIPAAVDQPVGRMLDKSGRGNHAVQANAASRPLLRRENGRFFLEFDGVDDALRASFSIAQPWDRVSAVRQIGSTGNDRIFGGVAVSSGNLIQSTVAPQVYLNSGVVGSSFARSLAVGTDGVATERHHGSASRIAINNGSYGVGDAGTVAVDGISIGDAATIISGRAGNIRLYGLLMIGRALGDAETVRLRRFMGAKIGLAL